MAEYQMIWKGPVMDATGYGTASRGYVLALDQLGFDVKIEPYSWHFPIKDKNRDDLERLGQLIAKSYNQAKTKIFIYHTPAETIQLCDKDDGLYRRILHTVWETNRFPNHWLSNMDPFHAVCVPCTQNLKALKSGGINIPVFLTPHGIDTNQFKPENKALPMKDAEGKFVFFSVFDFKHRKNPEALLEAYWKEFSTRDNVILVIKTYGENRNFIMRQIKGLKQKLDIKSETASLTVLTGILHDIELKGLYTMGDVFVLPTRGEGVGLPFMEALSSGMPVIATGWGGHMDFLNESNSFLVDYRLAYPGISMNHENAMSTRFQHQYLENGQIWAEASVDDLRKKMRDAYENPNLCKQKGQQGRADMIRWTWEEAGLALKQTIEKTINF